MTLRQPYALVHACVSWYVSSWRRHVRIFHAADSFYNILGKDFWDQSLRISERWIYIYIYVVWYWILICYRISYTLRPRCFAFVCTPNVQLAIDLLRVVYWKKQTAYACIACHFTQAPCLEVLDGCFWVSPRMGHFWSDPETGRPPRCHESSHGFQPQVHT